MTNAPPVTILAKSRIIIAKSRQAIKFHRAIIDAQGYLNDANFYRYWSVEPKASGLPKL